MDNMTTRRRKLVVEPIEDVVATDVPWLVYPYLIRGAGTLVSGAPGSGKSTFLTTLAARLSQGIDMAGNALPDGPQRVLYLELEEDPAWTTKPVLVANGAATGGRVFLPKKSQMDGSLTLGDPDIIDIALANGCTVIILAPLTSFFGGLDMNNATVVKPILQGFLDRCAEKNIATIFAHHTTKIRTGSDITSPSGSMQIAGTFRLMYNVYAPENRWADDSRYRWIVPTKCNIGTKTPPAICAWEMGLDDTGIPRVMHWIGETDDDIDEVRAGRCREILPRHPAPAALPLTDAPGKNSTTQQYRQESLHIR